MRRLEKLAAMLLLPGLVLGIHEGKLALWEGTDRRPEQIYDIRADSLPPSDRLRLQKGMELGSREELWQVLENYLE